jgi:iron(III) transport system permease protein
MIRWRLVVAVVLVLVVGVPLGQPLLDLVVHPGGWSLWEDIPRLGTLARTTLVLVGGTLILSLPPGVAAAVLLYRTDLPLRHLFRFLIVLLLFVPLPLLTTAWQAALGSGGLLAVPVWQSDVWQPWAQGLGPAIWIHALASWPWVVLIVGNGLCWVEGELEEDALLAADALTVLRLVTLRRCRPLVGAAALFVVLQTATEITVTDLLLVRTYAEEVYTQINLGGGDALARAVAVSLPLVLLTWLLILTTVPWLDRSLPPLTSLDRPPRVFALGRARWPCLVVVLAAAGLLAGVPLAGLVWKAGLHGVPSTWSATHVWERVAVAWELHGRLVVQSLFWAAGAGVVAAALALLTCWLMVRTFWFRALILFLLAGCLAMPGPVLGLGLKETIMTLVVWFPEGPMPALLYDGPSQLPVLWAQLLRFLPCAAAILWPVVRSFPEELVDAVRVDGARPGQELTQLIWPLSRRAFLVAALAVTALALGELAAGKLVETPGADTFAHVLFGLMHTGASSDVAALCLVMLAAVVAAALLVALGRSIRGSRGR